MFIFIIIRHHYFSQAHLQWSSIYLRPTAFDFDVIFTKVTPYRLTLSMICRRLIDWSNCVECSQIYWFSENFTLLPLESNNWLTVVTVIDRERRTTGATPIYLVCFFLAHFYLYYYYFYETHAIYELACI